MRSYLLNKRPTSNKSRTSISGSGTMLTLSLHCRSLETLIQSPIRTKVSRAQRLRSDEAALRRRDDATAATAQKLQNGGEDQMERERSAMPVGCIMRS